MLVQKDRQFGFSKKSRIDRADRRALVMSFGLWATCLAILALIATGQ
ncbi:MAG: hypothetical protein AAGF58_11530 [Pseudomonadota bacterium]